MFQDSGTALARLILSQSHNSTPDEASAAMKCLPAKSRFTPNLTVRAGRSEAFPIPFRRGVRARRCMADADLPGSVDQ